MKCANSKLRMCHFEKVMTKMTFITILAIQYCFLHQSPIFYRIERFKKQKLSYQMYIEIFINSRSLGDFLNSGGYFRGLSLFPNIFVEVISKFYFLTPLAIKWSKQDLVFSVKLPLSLIS